ncbi:MAG: translational GTPase TypA [Clostridia bacterium]|nr:translational GTPase TypA [Clostridia bacterium]MBQ3554204.1 translational GTPase TypA [Clostridia bacterium]
MGAKIRNVAIIAHVDHGKTTLVDVLLKNSGIYRDNEQVEDRVMDSNDLERERGITILSKNTSVQYKDVKINIVDTPGHADFGGEVERVLGMVEGVLLVVDAFEGAMPQTRFVLKKALELDLKPIVVVNKVDRPQARPYEVIDEVLDLFIELGASDEQADFPIIYASAKQGTCGLEPDEQEESMVPLFDTIVEHVPAPNDDTEGALQMLVSNIDYDEYIGRIAVGKVARGTIRYGQNVALCRADGTTANVKVGRLYTFDGLKRIETESVTCGDICSISGLGDVNIGETICDPTHIDPLPVIEVDEPTISMNFLVNNSPFAGQEGDFVTSRHLRERLFRELETNVSLKVEETDSADCFKVSGRGELHLSILIETMRRQGYEFQVSRPQVIFKEKNGKLLEPIEELVIDVPEEFSGNVIEKLGSRKAEMTNMHPTDGGYMRLEFKIPSRGLIGYRSEFLTDTKGNGVMNSVLDGFSEFRGEIEMRDRGSMIAWETGDTVTYGLANAETRGRLFVGPGVHVYEGMIVGENAKNEDLTVNVCKKKHVTNMRAAGSDDTIKLTPPLQMSLEQCLEFISDDELVEVTPESIRLRKKILAKSDRDKMAGRLKKQI